MKSLLSFLCLIMLVGSAFAATPATELLYVQQGQNVITYSVNTKTAVSKKLATLRTAYSGAAPIIMNRSGAFLYLLGFSPSVEYFTVYSLTAAGLPNPKPVQTLIVKPALSQFYIHPNGTIAYAMFSWTEVVDGWDLEVASDVVLFTINPNTGMLTNTKKNVANFPLNDSNATSIKSMNKAGTDLYFTSFYIGDNHAAGSAYASSTINAKTGVLGPQIYFWADEDFNDDQVSKIGNSVIVQTDNFGPYITVAPFDRTMGTFTCTSTMQAICGDTVDPFWIHPSNAYIFVNDQTLSETAILYINLPGQFLVASGASIPGPVEQMAFSRDGLLVYAQEGSQILTYVFNPHSGLLTAKTVISAPGVRSLLPWQ